MSFAMAGMGRYGSEGHVGNIDGERAVEVLVAVDSGGEWRVTRAVGIGPEERNVVEVRRLPLYVTSAG